MSSSKATRHPHTYYGGIEKTSVGGRWSWVKSGEKRREFKLIGTQNKRNRQGALSILVRFSQIVTVKEVSKRRSKCITADQAIYSSITMLRSRF